MAAKSVLRVTLYFKNHKERYMVINPAVVITKPQLIACNDAIDVFIFGFVKTSFNTSLGFAVPVVWLCAEVEL